MPVRAGGPFPEQAACIKQLYAHIEKKVKDRSVPADRVLLGDKTKKELLHGNSFNKSAFLRAVDEEWLIHSRQLRRSALARFFKDVTQWRNTGRCNGLSVLYRTLRGLYDELTAARSRLLLGKLVVRLPSGFIQIRNPFRTVAALHRKVRSLAHCAHTVRDGMRIYNDHVFVQLKELIEEKEHPIIKSPATEAAVQRLAADVAALPGAKSKVGCLTLGDDEHFRFRAFKQSPAADTTGRLSSLWSRLLVGNGKKDGSGKWDGGYLRKLYDGKIISFTFICEFVGQKTAAGRDAIIGSAAAVEQYLRNILLTDQAECITTAVGNFLYVIRVPGAKRRLREIPPFMPRLVNVDMSPQLLTYAQTHPRSDVPGARVAAAVTALAQVTVKHTGAPSFSSVLRLVDHIDRVLRKWCKLNGKVVMRIGISADHFVHRCNAYNTRAILKYRKRYTFTQLRNKRDKSKRCEVLTLVHFVPDVECDELNHWMLQMLPVLEAQLQRRFKDHLGTDMSLAMYYGAPLRYLKQVLEQAIADGTHKGEDQSDFNQTVGVSFREDVGARAYAVVRPLHETDPRKLHPARKPAAPKKKAAAGKR
jgi:hypothetical protein